MKNDRKVREILMIKEISIEGFRGFGNAEKISFSRPNGKLGSGLSFLVGANNAGKTTILEALRYFNMDSDNAPAFSEGKRNSKAKDKVRLVLTDDEDIKYTITSTENKGSMTEMYQNDNERVDYQKLKIFSLPSRRFVEYEFYRNEAGRYDYIRNQQMNTSNRSAVLNDFSARLFNMYKKKKEFDPLLKRVLGEDLEWTIDLKENNTFYLKFTIDGCTHSSEGVGDGIWSIFTICDALFDSEDNSIITIDEPELSLHPAYQKRVMNLLKEYSQNRQIIISTHSPYFIDWESIVNGASLSRVVKNKITSNIEIYSLSEEIKSNISKFMGNIYQPHTLGLEAKEVFFLEDNVILVEGQEDVVIYPQVAEKLKMKFEGNFFGWGVGGAGNMKYIIQILNDLGYKKVAIIFDGDQRTEKERLEKIYNQFAFFIIPADDIRDKEQRPCFAGKEGIVSKNGIVKECYAQDMKSIIQQINDYVDKPNIAI